MLSQTRASAPVQSTVTRTAVRNMFITTKSTGNRLRNADYQSLGMDDANQSARRPTLPTHRHVALPTPQLRPRHDKRRNHDQARQRTPGDRVNRVSVAKRDDGEPAERPFAAARRGVGVNEVRRHLIRRQPGSPAAVAIAASRANTSAPAWGRWGEGTCRPGSPPVGPEFGLAAAPTRGPCSI